jgi:hypothetical protein
MRRFAIVATLAFIVSACSPDVDTTASTNSCAKKLYPNYNARIMEQCVAVCEKCDNDTPTTCTTSCTLKGALSATHVPRPGNRLFSDDPDLRLASRKRQAREWTEVPLTKPTL